MPYNILLFPLVGGYYILLNFVYFKYKYQRLSSQRILFGSIVSGILLLFFVLGIRVLVESKFPSTFNSIANYLKSLPVKHTPFLWTSIFSFAIAFLGTNIFNFLLLKFNFFGADPPVSYAVRKYGDELEYLFRECAINGTLLQFTLKNNKVYVGFATYIPPPKETNYLKISPVLSGFRDNETKKINFTTDYYDGIEMYMNDPSKHNLFDWKRRT